MKRQSADLALMRKRLENLEKENRQLRRAFVAGALAIGVSLVIGVISGLRPAMGFGMGRGGGTHAVGPPGTSQEFVLRDGRGVVRAELDPSGRNLKFFDYRGVPGGVLNLETGATSPTRASRSPHENVTARPVMASTARTPVDRAPPGVAPVLSAAFVALDAASNPGWNPLGYKMPECRRENGAAKARVIATAQPPTEIHPPASPGRTLLAELALPQASRSPVPQQAIALPGLRPVLDVVPAPQAPVLPPATPLPAVILKVMGDVETPGEATAVVISDGLEVHVVHQGEVFDERFKVERITSSSVEIEDTANQQNISLPYTP